MIFPTMEVLDENDAARAEMWVCAEIGTWDDYYCSTEEEAREYYENRGREVLEEIAEHVFGSVQLDDEYACLKDDDHFTYVIRQKVQAAGEERLFYLSCEYTLNGALHMAVIFEPGFDQSLADKIGASMEGYSYAVELTENSGVEPTTTWSGGSDTTQNDLETSRDRLLHMLVYIKPLITALIWLGCLLFVCVFLRKRAFGERKSKDMLGRAAGKAADKWVFKESKAKRAGHEEHADCQVHEAAKYTGYRESLRTLHKSGLLTAKEMNELLEKHKNDI